jgi:hypothetical protein
VKLSISNALAVGSWSRRALADWRPAIRAELTEMLSVYTEEQRISALPSSQVAGRKLTPAI